MNDFVQRLGSVGAVWSEYQGVPIPTSFGDVIEEYRAARSTSALFALPHIEVVEATGDDQVEFLHVMVTNDISALSNVQGTYSTLLTDKGKMVADFVVISLDETMWLITDSARAPALIEHLDRYIIADDVELERLELVVLSLQGPKAGEIVSGAAGGLVPPKRPFDHAALEIGGQQITVVANDRTCLGGYDLLMSADSAEAVWELLTTGDGVCPAGMDALNILRTEAGTPWFGVDMTEKTIPLEAGLVNAISTSKGCYLGQETIVRILHQGHVNRKLVGLLPDTPDPPPLGTEILYNNKTTGTITSSVFSPSLDRPIALATVRRSASEPGTVVALSTGETATATVAGLPFDL
ncbi:MAG: aminomethyltransferase family protein [Candidatus Latescibacteria bacterium]|jgi:folate-binding protein YgfZ|nr:aminomethyltransferase family protein [Candidatus Latescibacterota bacterium]